MKEWRRIPGFPLYEVSDDGSVRKGEKILKFCFNRKGYRRIGLNPGHKMRSISSLVMEVFVGPRPTGYHIAHLDGDISNNSLNNLAYVTPKENESHKKLHGTVAIGERHGLSKLTDEQVDFIRMACRPWDRMFGFTNVARQLGVGRGTVESVYNGKTWPRAALSAPDVTRREE